MPSPLQIVVSKADGSCPHRLKSLVGDRDTKAITQMQIIAVIKELCVLLRSYNIEFMS